MFSLLLVLGGCPFVSEGDLAARLDLDGDGVPRPQDCDDDDASVGAALTQYADADGDGVGSDAAAAACTAAEGFVAVGGDCDDTRADAYPGADERCDGVDNDCDTLVDEADAVDVPTWYADADGDGYGVTASTVQSCLQPAGYAALGNDCDDADATVNPGVREVCDGRDEDCSGVVDDPHWWFDGDLDDYGRDDDPLVQCDQPAGRVPDGGDCDDADAAVNPGAAEVCDDADTDEDCDGLADDADPEGADDARPAYLDDDGDGYGNVSSSIPAACALASGYTFTGGDCDDTRADVNPGEYDTCYDGLDQDCDEVDDDDCDQDGFLVDDDCDDHDFYVNPGMAEACGDEVDNDCDGELAGGCQLFGDILLDDADARVNGMEAFDEAGTTAAGVGDVNGDGYDDIVVGGGYSASAGPRAVLFTGPLSGDTSWNDDGQAWTACDGDPYLGNQLAPGGDTDSDGRSNWLLASYSFDAEGDGDWEGAIYVLDSGGGSTCNAPTVIRGPTAGRSARLGGFVAGGHDFTGDGVPDVVTTMSDWDDSDGDGFSDWTGRLVVAAGPLSGEVSIDDVASLEVRGTGTATYWAPAPEFVGDLDGDGIAELAAVYADASIAGERDGAAWIFAGGSSGVAEPGDALAVVHGSAAGVGMGVAFAAHDTDGDGRDDLGLAEPSWPGGGSSGTGRLYVVTNLPAGTSSSADAPTRVENTGEAYYLGNSAASAGDLNGDGRSDLVVHAPADAEFYGSSLGSALVYFGPVTGILSQDDADARLYDNYGGSSSSAQSGVVAAAGDTDGDGFADLLVSDANESENVSYGGVTWIFRGGP